jgi:phenylalanine-4-hydroxylase
VIEGKPHPTTPTAGASGTPGPEIRDFNLDQVLEQKFLVSEEQKVLYAVESFDQIYEAAQEAEKRLGGVGRAASTTTDVGFSAGSAIR